MSTLSISCLTTSNLPWFMDLTFQVPIQYCFLQHRTLLPSPVTSTTGFYFCFGSFSSFFLELFLHWSPLAFWAPTDLGSSSFSFLTFCLFILFMGSQGKNSEVVCHSLLQWTTFCQNSPPWPNSMKLWAMLCRATQDGWVLVESSDEILTEFQILSMKTKLNISKRYIDCMLKW